LLIRSFIFCKACVSDNLKFAKLFECREVFHFADIVTTFGIQEKFLDIILRFYGSETEPRLVFNRF